MLKRQNRQDNPDRAVLGIKRGKHQDYWVKARTTRHYGIRGEVFEHYVSNVVPGRMTDITDAVQAIEKSRPLHPTQKLYETLSYTGASLDYLVGKFSQSLK